MDDCDRREIDCIIFWFNIIKHLIHNTTCLPAKASTKQLTPMSIRNILVMINNDAPNPSNSVEVEAFPS